MPPGCCTLETANSANVVCRPQKVLRKLGNGLAIGGKARQKVQSDADHAADTLITQLACWLSDTQHDDIFSP